MEVYHSVELWDLFFFLLNFIKQRRQVVLEKVQISHTSFPKKVWFHKLIANHSNPHIYSKKLLWQDFSKHFKAPFPKNVNNKSWNVDYSLKQRLIVFTLRLIATVVEYWIRYFSIKGCSTLLERKQHWMKLTLFHGIVP